MLAVFWLRPLSERFFGATPSIFPSADRFPLDFSRQKGHNNQNQWIHCHQHRRSIMGYVSISYKASTHPPRRNLPGPCDLHNHCLAAALVRPFRPGYSSGSLSSAAVDCGFCSGNPKIKRLSINLTICGHSGHKLGVWKWHKIKNHPHLRPNRKRMAKKLWNYPD